MSDLEPPRTPCAPFADEIVRLLSNGRFDLASEVAVQAEMETMLVATYGAAAVSREHRLGPGDRPDFLIDGRIVIEVKGAKHRGPAVLRQIERYASHPQVEWIIVVTARAMHLPKAFAWRETGRRVPVRVINLGRAWL